MSKTVKKGAMSNPPEIKIIGHDVINASELIAHDQNWRTHPQYQKEVMAQVLGKLGWLDSIKVNKRNMRIINGHMRVELALENDELVPVEYLDLTDEEEKLALATFDPIGNLAITEKEMLGGLLDGLSEQEETLEQLLDELRLEAISGSGDKGSAKGKTHEKLDDGLVPFEILITEGQREVVFKAINKAKINYRTELMGVALVEICKGYIENE